MFARMARRAGTEPYREYYSRHPSLQGIDDRMRGMPLLGEPGGQFYHSSIMGEANRFFSDIALIRPDDATVHLFANRLRNARDPSATVKGILRELGAVAAGCTSLEVSLVYSHKGRFDADYGRPVELNHPIVILFLVEMDYAQMRSAPRAETLRESARQYYRAAAISKTLSAVLHECGYDATSHHDAHYDLILPGLAVRAGLGELGRNNILVADRFGSRVRIGAVSTTMALRIDRQVDLGVDHFCRICRKCARSCPARALSFGDKSDVRGVAKWGTHVEQCYSYWRSVGTDCGICMAVCPFSHRSSWFHTLIRFVIRRASWSHRWAHFFDQAFYGKSWKGVRQ
jgi:ferredoxin